ncbi:MAG: cyclase [Candidatus Tectimicrobiota bacterium]|nr:MAG: cyclase [Candidatus Tectomicrobia bacterium]
MNAPFADAYPTFAQLPVREGAPAGSSWGVFGDDDQVGTLNFITAEHVLAAARLVRKGRVFSLNLPLDLPNPPLYGRQPYRHTLLVLGGGRARDDYLDNFYLQASSQWDALSHICHLRYGFYNGVRPEAVTGRPGSKLGIEHWAARGIAGRGVLVDVARYLEAQGQPLDARQRVAIEPALLDAVLRAQGVELRGGDLLLVRTGWLAQYLSWSAAERAAYDPEKGCPGLSATEAMAAYLWNHRVAAVVADNPGVEAMPATRETGGFLHTRLIALLGMALGELWDLEALAADCAADGVYECLVTAAPLHLRGGVGSPANALALK